MQGRLVRGVEHSELLFSLVKVYFKIKPLVSKTGI